MRLSILTPDMTVGRIGMIDPVPCAARVQHRSGAIDRQSARIGRCTCMPQLDKWMLVAVHERPAQCLLNLLSRRVMRIEMHSRVHAVPTSPHRCSLHTRHPACGLQRRSTTDRTVRRCRMAKTAILGDGLVRRTHIQRPRISDVEQSPSGGPAVPPAALSPRASAWRLLVT